MYLKPLFAKKLAGLMKAKIQLVPYVQDCPAIVQVCKE